MAQERLSMRKIKELLRLKYTAGLSHRQVAASLGLVILLGIALAIYAYF